MKPNRANGLASVPKNIFSVSAINQAQSAFVNHFLKKAGEKHGAHPSNLLFKALISGHIINMGILKKTSTNLKTLNFRT
jgi:hypothetical protein